VVPPERRTASGLARTPARQLGLRLLLVAVVIVFSVALGVVLGRWVAQPLAPAPATPSKSAPTTTPAPNRQPRPTDTSLIDAL
jgi:hypothetical protein